MAFIVYLSSFLETLVFCHNLANQLYQKHADKFIPSGGLGGRAYTQLRTGKADWPEWGSQLKNPIWSNPAFATLRQRWWPTTPPYFSTSVRRTKFLKKLKGGIRSSNTGFQSPLQRS